MKKADLGIALYILTAIAMLLITIPSGLLDIFLAFNIAISFTISIFPSFTGLLVTITILFTFSE